MNALANAKNLAKSMDGDGPTSVYERNIERAKVFALIAIAEELHRINAILALNSMARDFADLEEKTQELEERLEPRVDEPWETSGYDGD